MAIIGSCVQLGFSLFNSANAGLAIYTCTPVPSLRLPAMAYSISSLRKLGVSLPVRGAILLFFAFMPMFSNYGAAHQRRAVCRRVLVLLVQTVKLVACGPPSSRCQCRACGRTEARALCAPRLAAASLLGAMGSTFLRNGGLVVSLAACVIAAAFCAWDAHVAVVQPNRLVLRLWAPSRVSAGLVFSRVLAPAFASNMYFTKVFMPAHDITPGSKREILDSVPADGSFRPKARRASTRASTPTVKEDGTIVEAPCDGSVTDEERAVIDRVLKYYENLGRRYNPDKVGRRQKLL